MLAPLDNETIFKKAFTNKVVFEQFVQDLFGVDVQVDKIETEKQFEPPIAKINFRLDIYAETTDHRFVIEIQRIDYDYNFNRFLNYFVSLLIEQQEKAQQYAVPQTVLGVVVITRPYQITQLTGEPIKDNVMTIDFDPRNLKDERIKIFEHKLLFLNPHKSYMDAETPSNFKDWLDLFRLSIDSKMNLTLNLGNKGIAKTVEIIEYEKLDPETLRIMKVTEQRKAMITIVENEGIEKGKAKNQVETAIEMIKDGLPIEKIMQYTKLDRQTIEKLMDEHKSSS